MATTLQSAISAELGWTWRDYVGVASITNSNRLPFGKNLADGAGAGQADAVWHADAQTLSAGGSMTLALDALEQSMFGNAITIPLAGVKAILIVNKNSAGAGYLSVGGAAVDGWYAPFGSPDDTVKVMPDSPLLLANSRDGWDVGIGEKALKIAAVGGSVTFDVAVLGILAGASGSSSSSSAV